MGGQSPAAVAYQSPSQSRRHGRDSPGVQRRRSRGHLGDDAFRRGSAQAASIRGAANRGRHGRHSYGEPRGRVQVLLPAVHVRGKRIAYFSLLIEGCGVFPHTREPGAYIPHAYTPRQAGYSTAARRCGRCPAVGSTSAASVSRSLFAPSKPRRPGWGQTRQAVPRRRRVLHTRRRCRQPAPVRGPALLRP